MVYRVPRHLIHARYANLGVSLDEVCPQRRFLQLRIGTGHKVGSPKRRLEIAGVRMRMVGMVLHSFGGHFLRYRYRIGFGKFRRRVYVLN